MTENEVAKQIVDAAYRIHTTLGPGLLKSVYETVLAYELELAVFALSANSQFRLPIRARGSRWGLGRMWLWRTR
jgi:GxxExxY protein